jgi:type II secretory pathway component HofQ
LQSGVVTEKGPTLDEIHAEEERKEAELQAKKAAALAEAGSEDAEEDAPVEGDLLAAAEAMESISEKEAPAAEEPAAEEPAAEEPAAKESTESESDLMKLKKDALVEKAKAAGVATSGTKADIVARLLE